MPPKAKVLCQVEGCCGKWVSEKTARFHRQGKAPIMLRASVAEARRAAGRPHYNESRRVFHAIPTDLQPPNPTSTSTTLLSSTSAPSRPSMFEVDTLELDDDAMDTERDTPGPDLGTEATAGACTARFYLCSCHLESA